MKTKAALLTALALLIPLAGCSTDRKGETLSKIVDQVVEATRVTNGIRSELDKAIASVDQKKEKKLKKEDLAKTFKEMGKLRKVGSELLKLKADADDLKLRLKDEDRQALTETYSNRLKVQLDELKKAEEKLNASMARAESMTDESTANELRTELHNSKQEFISLTRRH